MFEGLRAYYHPQRREFAIFRLDDHLKRLERKGYLDNALVVFSSDHADALGDHGHIQKWTMYDTVVRVPLGKRDLLGVVWPGEPAPASEWVLRPVSAVFDGLPPLGADWCRLVDFAAGYYQRSVGELAAAVLPTMPCAMVSCCAVRPYSQPACSAHEKCAAMPVG